jgi:hypothetical protein
MGDEPEPRGVHNPRVVDLIAPDPERDGVELLMLETRAWGDDPQQLRQLESKFNSYLAYVQSGQLGRDYPEYDAKPVRFRLECTAPAQGEVGQMLAAMRDFAAGEGIDFVVTVSGGRRAG